ncbi:TatD family hydrolase [Uliginosibacterium gangwonense]|uniref:TatD family hydrolase n=1 Tax=Uliginosibacterium gangwonense TaxID=392736 RepID=UPI000378B9FC|nr:TatD family hydrolase [Uliginosibacterium gangwonense]
MAVSLIDTHLHLDAPEFAADCEAVVQAAHAAGVGRFVLPAIHLPSCTAVAELVQALPGSACAFGIHPLYVKEAHEDDIARLRDLLAGGRACALGEIGLDGFVADADPELQEWFFIEQLKLAKAFDLPVLLHVRRAQDRVLKYLRRHPVRGGIAHAFNGSVQQARIFIEMGFKLGFGGAMSYSGSSRIRQLAASMPLESIVLESDAPDIPPAWAPAQRNEPANVARFAQILADLRGLPLDAVAEATTRNACEVLGL